MCWTEPHGAVYSHSTEQQLVLREWGLPTVARSASDGAQTGTGPVARGQHWAPSSTLFVSCGPEGFGFAAHGVLCSIKMVLCNPEAACGVWDAERVGLCGGQARLSRGPRLCVPWDPGPAAPPHPRVNRAGRAR